MAEIIEFTHTEQALREYGEAVAQAYRQSLEQHGHRATRELIDSVGVEIIREQGGGISVALDLASYWKFVEWDTRPHWPPKGSLLQWIQAKPIIPQPDSRGRIPTPEQLDYLIRRKIARKGTTGTHDLSDTVDRVNAEWLPRIEEALAQDIDAAWEAQLWVLFGRSA